MSENTIQPKEEILKSIATIEKLLPIIKKHRDRIEQLIEVTPRKKKSFLHKVKELWIGDSPEDAFYLFEDGVRDLENGLDNLKGSI